VAVGGAVRALEAARAVAAAARAHEKRVAHINSSAYSAIGDMKASSGQVTPTRSAPGAEDEGEEEGGGCWEGAGGGGALEKEKINHHRPCAYRPLRAGAPGGAGGGAPQVKWGCSAWTALCTYSVLYCTAVHCTVVLYSTVCIALHCSAQYCAVLSCAALRALYCVCTVVLLIIFM